MPTPLALELDPKLSAVLLTMEDLFAPSQLDFVILPHDVGQTPNFGHHLKAKELYRDNLACVVRKGHPALAHQWDQQAYLNYRHVHVRDKELGTPIFEQTLSEQGLRRNIAV